MLSIFVDKKKAPAPPPRAITPIPLMHNLAPVATARSVQPSPDSSSDDKTDMEYDKIDEHGEALDSGIEYVDFFSNLSNYFKFVDILLNLTRLSQRPNLFKFNEI